MKEDDQRLAGLPLQTIEHVLALLPAAVGDAPPERVPSQAGRADSALTGADVRMAAASTVANLSRSLANRSVPAQSVMSCQTCVATPILASEHVAHNTCVGRRVRLLAWISCLGCSKMLHMRNSS